MTPPAKALRAKSLVVGYAALVGRDVRAPHMLSHLLPHLAVPFASV